MSCFTPSDGAVPLIVKRFPSANVVIVTPLVVAEGCTHTTMAGPPGVVFNMTVASMPTFS